MDSLKLVDDFRQVLRSVASTVNIITTELEGRRHGMVATAAISVSFEPPSFLVSINRSSSAYTALQARGAFAVNVLGEADEAVARHFMKMSGEDRFAVGSWRGYRGDPLLAQLPYLEDGHSTIFCRTASEVAFGTHTLFVGLVEDVLAGPKRRPLMYFESSFGSLTRSPSAFSTKFDPSLMPCPL